MPNDNKVKKENQLVIETGIGQAWLVQAKESMEA
jgi:hypothetical protein